ncbi:YkgJ family cysteine cluster protein [Oscillatoria sp. FACHB-1407]|uniref:YkgJ family cysteine cluster protein n=1 Tax=Oscillatoria sp. FACHB-1407 TaxID=2692847 RepID=UPI0016822731|nr:YkgJ family cysteine cluster protein [Oscillatoria sp. FACHB-1407]MBD2464365.1 YkgJ family cysteine cluster protein [Oscillatoria sp. FACHB-1407]
MCEMDEVQTLLHRLDERIESRVQAIRQERDWWPCRRGCDHCCHHLAHPLELSAAEWIRVDAAVAKLGTCEREIVEQKIDALLQQIGDRTLGSAVVCPYLNEQEGACRIYDSRPIACRTYGFFVARHDNQYCQQIETEITVRGEEAIVWGNAEAIRRDIEELSGAPIPFEVHYGDRTSRPVVTPLV